MYVINTTIELRDFLLKNVPDMIEIYRAAYSGIGDYSLLGKVAGEKSWTFLWWHRTYPRRIPYCEVIYPKTVRVIDLRVLARLTPKIKEFERLSGREVVVIQQSEWQRFD